jgi:tetratricopeptide (TPR) repeat protein
MIHALLAAALLLQPQASTPDLPPEAAALVRSGIEAENHRDLDAAVAAFRKATEAAPSAPVAFFKLGEAYMNKRDYAAAIPPLKRAVELRPDALPAHQLLGFALLTEGYASEAISHLELVHEYGALGIAQLQVGQASKAIANLQAALEKNPDDPDLLYYLGRAGSALSSQSLDKLLTASRASARGHQALGQNYFATKMLPEAAKEYEQAIALRPDLPGLHLELGQIYAASSDWEKAEQQFRYETKLQPGNAEAAYRLGDALLQQGKMKEAAAELQRSNELRPDMPDTLYAFGKADAVSNATAAEQALTRVVELEKGSPLAAQALFTLASIHRKQGKLEQAERETAEFQRLQAINNFSKTPHR